MQKSSIVWLLFIAIAYPGVAQTEKATWAVESRVTSFLQGGYEAGLYYYPKNSRFSLGLAVAGQNVTGAAKDLLFTSSNIDNLSIRLPWLVGFQTRYHFSKHMEGFFAELSVGGEEFRVTAGDRTESIYNGFVVPSIGYIWYPWQRNKFYVMPKVGGIFTFARAEERTLNGTTYELRPFFPSPGLSIGWKF